MSIKEKLKNLRLPFLPTFYRPNFTYKLPDFDFAMEKYRLYAFFFFLLFSTILFTGVFTYIGLTPSVLKGKNISSGISHHDFNQTILEGFLSGSLFISGVLGSFIIRRANRYVTERYKAVTRFYLGFILLIVAIMGFLFLVRTK